MVEDFQQQMVDQLLANLQAKKTAALKEKMKALGILEEFEELEKQLTKPRFNKFLVEQHQGIGELYYYDDGSLNGMFIIGFTMPENELPLLDFKEPYKTEVKISCRPIEVEPERVKRKDLTNEQVFRAGEEDKRTS